MAEIGWTLDHQDDIDADFLAIYGLDLYEQEIAGPRYFALAHRLTAYQGVMAARIEEERDQPTERTTPTRTQDTVSPPQRDGSETQVSLTQFRATFPGLVSVAQGG
jgi:hypothetical protein